MKRIFTLFLTAILLCAPVAALGETAQEHEHILAAPPDCEHAGYCTICGAEILPAKGHDWKAADCENPRTCLLCGKTDGEKLGHEWVVASCTEPAYCLRCGEKRGEPLGHDWLPATYDAPETCSRCRITRGEALSKPSYADAMEGEIVLFGTYEQDGDKRNGREPIEWIVLENDGSKLTLMSRYALDCRKYNDTLTEVTWETCSLREWLNNDFYSAAFTSEEQALLCTVTKKNPRNPDYVNYTRDGNPTQDKVYLLSAGEVSVRYGNSETYDYFLTSGALYCVPTAYAVARGANNMGGYCWWWLRTPGLNHTRESLGNKDGTVFYDGDNVNTTDNAVRPVITLRISKESSQVETPVETASQLEPWSVYAGETVELGSYEQDNNTNNGAEPIEWIVLFVDGDNALLVSKYVLDAQPFSNYSPSATWETSYLRRWLNSDFCAAAFHEQDLQRINMATVNPDPNPEFPGTDQGNVTFDRVFILSLQDLRWYFPSDSARQCKGTRYAFDTRHVFEWTGGSRDANGMANTYWWTRTNGFAGSYVSVIYLGGQPDERGENNLTRANVGVRPAISIRLK